MKYLIIFFIFLVPTIAWGQNRYEPLVGIPGVDPNASDFNTYVNSLYALSIAIAALLAVIKIIIAGVKWMLSDLVNTKQQAKDDIKGALFGLLIILSAVLIISVINRDILDVNINFDPVPVPAAQQTQTGANSNVPNPAAGNVVSNAGNQQGSGVTTATCTTLAGTIVGSVCNNMRGAGGNGMTAEVCNAFGGNFAPGSGSCENVRIN